MALTPETVITAIEKHNGIIAHVARSLKCNRGTVYNYIHAHPDVKAALDDARECLIDEAESSLLKAIKEGEGWAVCFALKTQGRKRGYAERIEHTGADGGPLEIKAIDYRAGLAAVAPADGE